LLRRLHAVRAAANPEPPQWSDLPEGLVSRFIGRSGRYLMQIYSKADLWTMESMEQFVQQVRSVDRDATGNPMQIYESSWRMKRSFEQAAWYALAVVLVTVYIDFRSILATALALVPLGLAMLQLYGLMGLLNIPLNPANMIVLPLILGVGVDIGVHIVHDYQRESAPYRMSGSTATAIVVNTLMNMVGFGSLMIASHRGIYSLGQVLTLGMTCNLLSGLFMPSLLRLLQSMRATSRASDTIEPRDQGFLSQYPPAPVQPRTAAIRRRVEKAA
jgi:predicted RND superfamily exporter protein